MGASIMDCAAEQLRARGAEFAYLYGSRASGSARADSDFDVAAYFADSPVDRVRWESQTRKVYSDEKYRIDRSHREFLEEQHVVDEVRVIQLLRAASGALGQRGILDPGTADRMRMAVVFGDVLLHEWVGVDDSIVLARLADLSDLEGFIVQVSRWLSVPPGTP